MKKELIFKLLLLLCVLPAFVANLWADDEVEIDIDLTVECCCDLTCLFSVADSDIGTLSYDYSRCRDVLFLPRLIEACDSEDFEDRLCSYWNFKWELAQANGISWRDIDNAGWEGEGCATSCISESLIGPDDAALDMLREFRDKVLAKTDSGRALIDLYYESAKPVRSAFRRSPHLKAHAQDLLEKILPVVRASLDSPGSGISLGKELSEEIDMFIEELDASVKGGMRETLFALKRDLIRCQ